jgi:hypothetical protein
VTVAGFVRGRLFVFLAGIAASIVWRQTDGRGLGTFRFHFRILHGWFSPKQKGHHLSRVMAFDLLVQDGCWLDHPVRVGL